jgi:tetratricopeptide (TPR) repeat protein
MQLGDQQETYHSRKSPSSPYNTILSSSPVPLATTQDRPTTVAFGLNAMTPPPTDPQITMQRADEINNIQSMFGDVQTSAVILIGSPGSGKSMLAALLFRRLQMAKNGGLAAPKYMVWLTIGTYTTLPDIITAILDGIGMPDKGLFLLKPEQQISSLLRALRRSGENALVVLDQFELLLHPETQQGVAGRGVLPLFLEMLQTDLGTSRILLTSYNSPYDENKIEQPRVRAYLVTRISLPEGVALLQQRGVQGKPEEISFIWQRCAGHAYALVLCSALVHLSNISLDILLNSPDYRPLWSGDVIANLIIAIHYFLNPTQNAIVHALSLFHEPVPKAGIFITITGETITAQKQNEQADVVGVFEQELQLLTHLGIIQTLFSATNTFCYTLHPLLRQYTLEHFMEDMTQRGKAGHVPPWADNTLQVSDTQKEQLQSALIAGHIQVASYYENTIREQCPPREQRVKLQDIAPIITTLRHLCLGQRWQRACDLLFRENLHETMVLWGAWNTLIGLYTAMLPPFGILRPVDEGLVASQVGMLYGRIGEYQQSKTYFDKAITLQREIGNKHGEAVSLTNQGELLRIHGDYNQARQNFEIALSLSAQPSNPQLKSVIYHNLGLLSQHGRDYKQASIYYTKALALAAQIEHQQYAGTILTNLGMLLYEEHHYQEALSILFSALQIRQGLQDPTTSLLERFLVAVEQKMGSEKYKQLCIEALQIQPQVLDRFLPSDMRQ